MNNEHDEDTCDFCKAVHEADTANSHLIEDIISKNNKLKICIICNGSVVHFPNCTLNILLSKIDKLNGMSSEMVLH